MLSVIIRYRTILEREKFNIMTAFEIIYDSYRNDKPNLKELRSSGVIWTPEIIPEGLPTREDLKDIGEHLHNRMEALQAVQKKWNRTGMIISQLTRSSTWLRTKPFRAREIHEYSF